MDLYHRLFSDSLENAIRLEKNHVLNSFQMNFLKNILKLLFFYSLMELIFNKIFYNARKFDAASSGCASVSPSETLGESPQKFWS